MMLDHLGEKAAAARLMKAVERVTADPSLHTPDLGGQATTRQVTDAVVRAIAEKRPLRAVFRDSAFTSDAARINTEQVFREVSPETQVRAI